MSQNLQLKRCRPHPFVKISFSSNNIVQQRIADNPSKCVEVVLFVNEIQLKECNSVSHEIIFGNGSSHRKYCVVSVASVYDFICCILGD